MTEEMGALFSELFEAASAGRRSGEEIAGVVGQTQARWQTLWTVAAGPFTVPQISRRLGVTRQSIQRLVNDLLDEDLVTLVDNPDHKTSPLVELTAEGRAALDQIDSAGQSFSTSLYRELGPEQVAELRRLLRRFTDAVKATPAVPDAAGAQRTASQHPR